MKKMLRASLLALACTLVTCSPPPFNLAISESARVAAKLTLLGQVGPLDPQMGSQGSPDYVFFPEKDGLGGITLQAGFVYLASPTDGEHVGFLASTGGQYQRYGPSLGLGSVSSDPYPANLLQSVKSGHNGIAFQFYDASPGSNQYTIATGDPATNSFSSIAPIQLNSLVTVAPFNGTGKEVIGLSVYPDPSTTSDRTYWLFRESLTSNYLEAQFSFSQVPILPPGIALRGTTPYDVSSFADTPNNRVLYYYDPLTVRSYVSVWNSPMSSGGWSTWVWVDNLPVPTHWQLTTIANRIDALLTTGEMFSAEGNVGRVYDPKSPTGTLEAEFTLGTLRFIGEVYMGGTPAVLFSQALWFNRQLTFNVYSIPTSQLTSLGQ